MPIRSQREFVCKSCGKRFYEIMGDAIKPEEAKIIENPHCKKCRKNKRKEELKNGRTNKG